MLSTIGLMVYYLFYNELKILVDIGLIYLLIIILFMVFRYTKHIGDTQIL